MCHKHFFSWIWRLFVKSSVLNKCKILYSAILTSKFHFGKWKYPQVIKKQSNIFGTSNQFSGRWFFFVDRWGSRVGEVGEDGFSMIQVRYIYCAFYFYYYYISSSEHQAVDPGGWGPLYKKALICLPCSYCFSIWGGFTHFLIDAT